jgi:restriction endonuclease S subunit
LAELITKGASPNWQGINYTDQGILFITSENVGLGHLVLKNKKYVEERFNVLQKRSILMKGDLLTNIVGASIGRSAIFELDEKANINQAVALIRLDDEVNRHYILNVLNSPDLIGFMYQEKVDVARANLNLEDISNFPIPLPPLPEQQEIVRRVEALFKIADQIEERYKKARGYVDKLTQSILAKAFRGELVPQDPNDESASVLLERIREERNRRRDKSQTGKTKNHRRQRRQNQLRMDI